VTRIRVAGTVDSNVVEALDGEVSRLQKINKDLGCSEPTYSDVLQTTLEKGLGLGLSENRKQLNNETVADGTHFDVNLSFESFGIIAKASPYKKPVRTFCIPTNIVNSLSFAEGGFFEIAVRRITKDEYYKKYDFGSLEEKPSGLTKKCLNEKCGEEFEAQLSYQKYCSLKCYKETRHKKVFEEKKCLCCRTMFTPTHSAQKFCGFKCYQLNSNHLHRERYVNRKAERAKEVS
jgi:hypothetical protein